MTQRDGQLIDVLFWCLVIVVLDLIGVIVIGKRLEDFQKLLLVRRVVFFVKLGEAVEQLLEVLLGGRLGGSCPDWVLHVELVDFLLDGFLGLTSFKERVVDQDSFEG